MHRCSNFGRACTSQVLLSNDCQYGGFSIALVKMSYCLLWYSGYVVIWLCSDKLSSSSPGPSSPPAAAVLSEGFAPPPCLTAAQPSLVPPPIASSTCHHLLHCADLQCRQEHLLASPDLWSQASETLHEESLPWALAAERKT